MQNIFYPIILCVLTCLLSPFSWAGCGSKQQFNCMVSAINGEARGEGYRGMLVVGKALKTRKIRGYIGGSICGIARKSFAPRSMSSRGTPKRVRALIIKAAKAACASRDAGYTHFHSFRSKYATSWAKKFKFKGKVGGHWLFNAPRGIKAHFFGTMNGVSEENFVTEADVYFFQAEDEEALKLYSSEDDRSIEEILEEPYTGDLEI